MNHQSFSIANTVVNPGERKMLKLPETTLYTQTPIKIPVYVAHGKLPGPKIFITAAIHGDEINGVEIIRRLIFNSHLKNLNGTLIAVPVVNILGFLNLSRYLPDRRDLNRAFPGSKTGSLAARIANLLMEEIITKCTHGIDLHTGNIHSENVPHIRTNISVNESLNMAYAFNVPIIIDAKIRDGSMREAATELNIPILVYEAGAALRFNELAIRIGLRGILNVLQKLGMIRNYKIKQQKKLKAKVSSYTSWIRAPQSGIVHSFCKLGMAVEKGEKLGVIKNPFEDKETEIFSHITGIVIGKNTLPLINEGDALFHIAKIKGKDSVASEIIELKDDLNNDPFAYF